MFISAHTIPVSSTYFKVYNLITAVFFPTRTSTSQFGGNFVEQSSVEIYTEAWSK